MKKEYNIDYLFKVWILSLFLAPALLLAAGFLTSTNAEFDLPAIIGFAFLFVGYSFILSIPTLAVNLGVYIFIKSNKVAKLFLKIIIAAISILGLFITFYLAFGKETLTLSNDLIFPVAYSISIIISSMICRLKEI